MNRTTAAVAAATFAAALVLTSCTTTTEAPSTHQPVSAPTVMPSVSGAETGAEEFIRFVQEKGTSQQRTAVIGHVSQVARSASQGDHRNSYIATDYPQPDDATTRAIINAYLAWAGPADDAVMLVLYTAAGTVMGAVELGAWRTPSPASSGQ
ncbi:hypothetical protein OG401_00200 [Kitasatospora purpeofusca]|uniref:hypothetical protein n=1 Tax=Kitasatospora purpeofusca TaxID=67352 RepID=UPI0022522254|nr:hypothetical protein [Kitasatospora purpeofusca]MCX4682745.1 hypothetical protein [Kitasatospora purpeofusca]WSR46043.1 hypothetical protein OG196_43880 [Kitasatospora purpeofusca]